MEVERRDGMTLRSPHEELMILSCELVKIGGQCVVGRGCGRGGDECGRLWRSHAGLRHHVCCPGEGGGYLSKSLVLLKHCCQLRCPREAVNTGVGN